MPTRTLRNLCLASIIVAVAACDGAGDNDDDGFDQTNPCTSTEAVCMEDACEPLVRCDAGCTEEAGVDSTGAAYRTICTATRKGRSPDPTASGNYGRRVVTVTDVCYATRVFANDAYRVTDRCEHRFRTELFGLFCEGTPSGGNSCYAPSEPARCRSIHVTVDGNVERSETCD